MGTCLNCYFLTSCWNIKSTFVAHFSMNGSRKMCGERNSFGKNFRVRRWDSNPRPSVLDSQLFLVNFLGSGHWDWLNWQRVRSISVLVLGTRQIWTGSNISNMRKVFYQDIQQRVGKTSVLDILSRWNTVSLECLICMFSTRIQTSFILWFSPGGWGGAFLIPYNGLYRDAPPERGTLFRLEVNKRVGISENWHLGIKRDIKIPNRCT